jgi:hypothetical protein
MATLRDLMVPLGALASLAAAGCGKPVNANTPATALTQVHLLVTGDLTSVTPAGAAGDTPNLHVALAWGMQWQPEPFCIMQDQPPEVAAVMAAGCPDNFRFVPDRVGADILVEPNSPAVINLYTLPGADVMVGDITSRIAYASLIVYDDRNGNGKFDLRHPPHRHHHEEAEDAPGPPDLVYGASFISMTMPDRRIAFLEGKFVESAFYPRHGCPEDPPKSFSILSAGGFTQEAGMSAALQGQLPLEDPASCAVNTLDDTIVIQLQSPTSLGQLACTASDGGGTTAYQEARTTAPAGLSSRAWACTGFPHLPNDPPRLVPGQQLVIVSTQSDFASLEDDAGTAGDGASSQDDAGPAPSSSSDFCHSVTHYTLRGCANDPACFAPRWDHTANPPSWWPCPLSP